MLSQARARRLVRRGSSRARRILRTALERGDVTAAEVCWQDKVSWIFVPEVVLAAAVNPALDAGVRAGVGEFCARHDVAPENTVDRVVFFVLTGQHEQYQALDPDGSLLSSAYRGADEPTREALRQAVVSSGELDLVRVVADRPDRTLTAPEAEYLTASLAGAGQWDRLWRLVPAMPLPSAVLAARRFTDWRPADDLARAFLARLAKADPDLLTVSATTRFKAGAFPQALSFAPDGTELAVTAEAGTKVFSLPGGRQIAHYSGRTQLHVLALGDGVVVYTGHKIGGSYPLVRRTPGGRTESLLDDAASARIGRTPGGFVVAQYSGLFYGSASGWRPATRPKIGAATSAHSLIAAEPASGNLAFRVYDHDKRHLALVDSRRKVLARKPVDGPLDGGFCGPDRLVLWQWGDGRAVEVWRLDGRNLVQAAKIGLGEYMTPVVVPARDRVVVRGGGGLRWLDADTLTPVEAPPGLSSIECQHLAFSQDGGLAAVSTSNGVEVHDLGLRELAELAGRPLSQARVADLETVTRLGKQALTPAAEQVLELVSAALEYRFGGEIALGSGTRDLTREDDIALGGG